MKWRERRAPAGSQSGRSSDAPPHLPVDTG